MALQKQTINVNFAQGINTKADPRQLKLGKFIELQNSVFGTEGLWVKRNGYGALSALSDATNRFLTTFNGNLTAIGTAFNALSAGSGTWVNKGAFHPIGLETLPLIRNSLNQSQCDSAIASNGLVCTVYTEQSSNGATTTAVYKYAVADSTTGQNVVAPAAIAPTSGAVTGSPRVFYVGNFFVIVFTNLITATNHLQYIAINVTTLGVSANVDISAQYTPASTVAFDGCVANDNLYLAWNGSDGGGAIRMTYIDRTLLQHNTVTFAGRVATHMSVCADTTGSTAVVYAAFYSSGTSTGYVLAVNQSLVTILAPTQYVSATTVINVTAAAKSGVCTIFYQVSTTYSYDGAIRTDIIKSRTCTQAGVLGTAATAARALGIGSKAFIQDSVIYLLGTYNSTYQPSYFLITAAGAIVSKLAYSNGQSGYQVTGLPSVSVNDDAASLSYLIQDLVAPVNKIQGSANSLPVYTQTGINLATFDFDPAALGSAEIGSNLHLTGGFLWMYDGYRPVESGFFVWPDYVEVTGSGAGGTMTAQQYYYVATYEWEDNQGNVFRSAPSIPVTVTTTGATSSVTINVPTLRLTYKTANPPSIVIYRWSVAQQVYYRVTSRTAPIPNSTTTDSVAFVDTLPDSSIIGNDILYTTGGVVENIAPPAISALSTFKSRLFAINAEDPNQLLYSKQVIENTPVEMSDLFTQFVSPAVGAQGPTGPMKVIAPMDDKLVIWKKNAIFYMTGTGPDNTGANNDFSEPVFITSTIGSDNPASIVFIPQGLMFQSDKGIWLLSRGLETVYIGADVQAFNDNRVQSAVNVPGTTQVRFTLDNGITLMYDYYYGQWGTFVNVPAISSTLYQGLHTYINDSGAVYQETPGAYLDGSNPVLMACKTGWINLAGMQGLERAYFFYLLATYLSPHKLQIQVAYDYAPSPSQTLIITPDNYNPPYGYGANTDNPGPYGAQGPYGGNSSVEQWRVFMNQQKCQAFQLSITEMFDPSLGVPAGAGFEMSGLDLVVGLKKGYTTIKAARSTG